MASVPVGKELSLEFYMFLGRSELLDVRGVFRNRLEFENNSTMVNSRELNDKIAIKAASI